MFWLKVHSPEDEHFGNRKDGASRWEQEVAKRRGNIPEETYPAVRYLRVKTIVAGDGECGNPRGKERGREEGRSEREEGQEGWEDRDPRVGTPSGQEVLLPDRSSNWSVCTFGLSRRNLKVVQGILKAGGGGLWARPLLLLLGTGFFVVLFFVISPSRFFLRSCPVGLLRLPWRSLGSCFSFSSYHGIDFSYFEFTYLISIMDVR